MGRRTFRLPSDLPVSFVSWTILLIEPRSPKTRRCPPLHRAPCVLDHLGGPTRPVSSHPTQGVITASRLIDIVQLSKRSRPRFEQATGRSCSSRPCISSLTSAGCSKVLVRTHCHSLCRSPLDLQPAQLKREQSLPNRSTPGFIRRCHSEESRNTIVNGMFFTFLLAGTHAQPFNLFALSLSSMTRQTTPTPNEIASDLLFPPIPRTTRNSVLPTPPLDIHFPITFASSERRCN